MFFKGKKVLVAGGTGLIGIPLVKLLIEQGAQVRIASLDDPSRAHHEAEFLQTDLMLFENCQSETSFGIRHANGMRITRIIAILVFIIVLHFQVFLFSKKLSIIRPF